MNLGPSQNGSVESFPTQQKRTIIHKPDRVVAELFSVHSRQLCGQVTKTVRTVPERDPIHIDKAAKPTGRNIGMKATKAREEPLGQLIIMISNDLCP